MAFAVTIVGFTLILLARILLAPTDIGSPATESAALIRANERVLEMVKWTISTLLLVGGGLIGLNWYTNEQRYTTDLARLRSDYDERLKNVTALVIDRNTEHRVVLDQLTDLQSDTFAIKHQISRMILFPHGMGDFVSTSENTVRLLRRVDVVDVLKRHQLQSVIFALKSSDQPSSFSSFILGPEQLPEVIKAARAAGFAAEAMEIETLFMRWNEKSDLRSSSVDKEQRERD